MSMSGVTPRSGAISAEEVRHLLLRQIDENQLLAAALNEMRGRIEELERLVETDTLTPLPNRRRFVREIERVIQQRGRYGTNATVMFVDLDGLKLINDNHGHQAGDAALIHVADILQARVRACDIVARIGGDEFGLLVEHMDVEAAREKAESLIAAVATTPFEAGGLPLSLSISIGLAELNDDDDAETLVARADEAMYALRAEARAALRALSSVRTDNSGRGLRDCRRVRTRLAGRSGFRGR